MIPFLDEVPLLKDPYGAKSRWLAQPKVVMHPKRKRFGSQAFGKTEFVDAAPRLPDNGIKRGFRSSPSLSRAPPAIRARELINASLTNVLW